jgi:hypothetical protein
MYQISYVWSDFSGSICRGPRAEGGCIKDTAIWSESAKYINRCARMGVECTKISDIWSDWKKSLIRDAGRGSFYQIYRHLIRVR